MKARFSGIYVEIGNICNLRCSFCSGTKREGRVMSAAEFAEVAEKIKGYTDKVYLHVLGEPLCHPELAAILDSCRQSGIKASVTTNGTLLSSRGYTLLERADAVHRVSISLHSFEANSGYSRSLSEYVGAAMDFADAAAERGIYSVFRLWNMDSDAGEGKNEFNSHIIALLRERYHGEWAKRYTGYRIARNIFLEFAGLFDWPRDSTAAPVTDGYCHALSSQIAILADGSVVPCCLDCDGDMTLGNIFVSSLADVLSTERAERMKRGFEQRKFTESLCQRCTYARRF